MVIFAEILKNTMRTDRTFTMLKPDSVEKGNIGPILEKITSAGFRIVAMKLTQMTTADAEAFYAIHKERPFFGELCEFMTSGPVVLMILEGEEAIARNREIMGATNPDDADSGTIRRDFAASIEENVVHGSDCPDTAAEEIAFFFGDDGICPRTR